MVRIASILLFTSACVAASTAVEAVDAAATFASAADSPPRRPEDIDCASSKSGSSDLDGADFSYSNDFDPDWGNVVGPFGQCGGEDHDGPTECIQDWTCYEFKNGFSQCIPDASITTTDSSSGSTGDEPCSDEPTPTSPCPDEPVSDSPAPASTGEPDPALSPAPSSSEPPTDAPAPTTAEPVPSEPPVPVTETPVPSSVDPSTMPTTDSPTETPSPPTETPTTEPPATDAPPTDAPTRIPAPASPEPTTSTPEPTADTPVVSPADPTPVPTRVTPVVPTEEPTTPSQAPATTPPSQGQTDLVGAWQQCGGLGFDYTKHEVDTGDDQSGTAKLNCVSGYQCDTMNEYFAQCVPRHEPGRGSYWAQCGGESFSGSTTCTSGSTCTYYNEWYSQCVPLEKATAS